MGRSISGNCSSVREDNKPFPPSQLSVVALLLSFADVRSNVRGNNKLNNKIQQRRFVESQITIRVRWEVTRFSKKR